MTKSYVTDCPALRFNLAQHNEPVFPIVMFELCFPCNFHRKSFTAPGVEMLVADFVIIRL